MEFTAVFPIVNTRIKSHPRTNYSFLFIHSEVFVRFRLQRNEDKFSLFIEYDQNSANKQTQRLGRTTIVLRGKRFMQTKHTQNQSMFIIGFILNYKE